MSKFKEGQFVVCNKADLGDSATREYCGLSGEMKNAAQLKYRMQVVTVDEPSTVVLCTSLKFKGDKWWFHEDDLKLSRPKSLENK